MRALGRIALAVAVLAALLLAGLRLRYGGGGAFPDRTTPPSLSAEALETVADLDHPPGNVAVAADGRVFFTLHPEASPPIQVAELVDGRAVAFPDADFQRTGSHPLRFRSVLSLRVDRQVRLWTLDNADHALGQPRLLAFDPESRRVVHRHDFASGIAGLGSHLNDFQVDPDGRRIYIADASILAQTPALIVYDVERGLSRRLLEGHPSVRAERFVPVVQGRRMQLFGIFAIRPGVDSIALDRAGEWLYFGAVTARQLYRVRVRDLDDENLDAEELAARVEAFAPKTMSDGITTDVAGGIYLSDPEHSAVLRLAPDGSLETLLADPRLRWPDGFSFGPGGWLYVTCSALHHVLGRSAAHVRSQAPYQIYRLRPATSGIPGH